tara:strand:+ start:482 stop:601 length:120 start_codon:yes stop_codon:yes gene_type:complete
MYDLTEFPETRICFLFEAVDKDNINVVVLDDFVVFTQFN